MHRARAGVFFEPRQHYREFIHADGVANSSATLQTEHVEKSREFLPIVEVSAHVEIVNTTCRTKLTQVFSNLTQRAIEQASYCFPLYHSSIVTGYRHWQNGESFEGKIKPKETARREFQEAVKNEQATSLLEAHTSEIFEIAIGNIAMGQDIRIEIIYLTELKFDIGGDSLVLTIPSSIAPRYGDPPTGFSSSTQASLERGMAIQVDVSLPVPIKGLRSRTHPISVEQGFAHSSSLSASLSDLARSPTKAKFDITKARAELSSKEATLNRDFVLVITAAPPDGSENLGLLAPRAILESCDRHPDLSVLQVAFTPRDLFPLRKNLPTENLEIVFLVDRSGSMDSKMNSLRRALNLLVGNLPRGSLLNIFGFGSSVEALWEQSKELNPATLEEAVQYISTIQANMGGTKIRNALNHVTDNTQANLSTQVIVLTDGQVWETYNVVNYVNTVKRQRGDALRYFALGIGDEVSHELIEGIGKYGGGYAEVVAVDSPDQWDDRVQRMLNGIFTSSAWEIKLSLKDELGTMHDSNGFFTHKKSPHDETGSVMQVPHLLPAQHGFLRTVLYFLINPSEKHYTSVHIQGSTPDGRLFESEIPIVHANVPEPLCHTLAARALINNLEMGNSWLHETKRKSTMETPEFLAQQVDIEAEHVAMKWGLASKWTSFIAVAEQSPTVLPGSINRYNHITREAHELMKPRRDYVSSAIHRVTHQTTGNGNFPRLRTLGFRSQGYKGSDSEQEDGYYKPKMLPKTNTLAPQSLGVYSDRSQAEYSAHSLKSPQTEEGQSSISMADPRMFPRARKPSNRYKSHKGSEFSVEAENYDEPTTPVTSQEETIEFFQSMHDRLTRSPSHRASSTSSLTSSQTKGQFSRDYVETILAPPAPVPQTVEALRPIPQDLSENRVFQNILQSFDAEALEALERACIEVSCPETERTRVCQTILCTQYMRRIVSEVGSDPILDEKLKRAEQWLATILSENSAREMLEQEAQRHWIGGIKPLGEKILELVALTDWWDDMTETMSGISWDDIFSKERATPQTPPSPASPPLTSDSSSKNTQQLTPETPHTESTESDSTMQDSAHSQLPHHTQNRTEDLQSMQD
ncbi:unnamed protein product [Periconia digitata]|uniref:Uncharacterized protein n=1 Tax=Periconia digitata TaxID=1303443 RepID=A0A9W4U8U5_9PLEO|nr:unnamed protein product [Periconia digitata]